MCFAVRTCRLTQMSSNEIQTNAAQRTVVDMEGVARSCRDRAREGAAQNYVVRVQDFVVWRDLVREPWNTGGGVVQYRGGEAAFFHGAVLIEQGANPAKVDVHRTYRSSAQHDAGIRREVRDCVVDLARRL